MDVRSRKVHTFLAMALANAFVVMLPLKETMLLAEVI